MQAAILIHAPLEENAGAEKPPPSELSAFFATRFDENDAKGLNVRAVARGPCRGI
jgi:hypothetical protein